MRRFADRTETLLEERLMSVTAHAKGLLLQLVQDLSNTTSSLTTLPAVNGLLAAKSVNIEMAEFNAAPMPCARPRSSELKHSAPATNPSAPEPSYRTASGHLTSSKKKALKAMLELVWKADKEGGLFKQPVTKRIAPDYSEIVKEPMDLKTVRQTLDKGSYADVHAFKHVRSIPTSRQRCFLTVSLSPSDHVLI